MLQLMSLQADRFIFGAQKAFRLISSELSAAQSSAIALERITLDPPESIAQYVSHCDCAAGASLEPHWPPEKGQIPQPEWRRPLLWRGRRTWHAGHDGRY